MHRALGVHAEAGFRLIRTGSCGFQVLTPSGLVYCVEADWKGYSVRPWFGTTEELRSVAPDLAAAVATVVAHYRRLDEHGPQAPAFWKRSSDQWI